MFIYTQVILQNPETKEQVLAPIAFRKADIASYRVYPESEETPEHLKRHSAITLASGYEIFVTSTFAELKKMIDPDSPDGNWEKPVWSPVPTLTLGQ